MDKFIFLDSEQSRALYETVKDLPILDYHCHLDPKEIYEDRPFENLGAMWLHHDHYKWRLMRAGGVDEELITGSASDRAKFDAYASAVTLAAGNPLYHWTQMELSQFFGIEEPLGPDTAESIWQRANEIIRSKSLSPRKLIEASRVQYIATTDDPADSLVYHDKIKEDISFACQVVPSFRTDRVLSIRAEGYADYVAKLAEAAGMEIKDLSSLKEALCRRMDFFSARGCRFSDVGIPAFPEGVLGEQAAASVFARALSGQSIGEEEYRGFLGHMYVFLGGEYKKRDMVMQLHMAVRRNTNTRLFERAGADAGGDCMDDVVSMDSLLSLLDAMALADSLPKSILYSLNPTMIPALCAAAGSFTDVRCGAAWWFCDHKRGIREVLETVAEIGHLAAFPGMLTDSRSFLSYARHDYFRRILCSLLAGWTQKGEFDKAAAPLLARKLCYENTKELIGGAEK
ncbi:MAG: glucuronate isomerase [Clostridiales bacterium]|nr:glucuronate isomerase [Clostridiales bacterium]